MKRKYWQENNNHYKSWMFPNLFSYSTNIKEQKKVKWRTEKVGAKNIQKKVERNFEPKKIWKLCLWDQRILSFQSCFLFISTQVCRISVKFLPPSLSSKQATVLCVHFFAQLVSALSIIYFSDAPENQKLTATVKSHKNSRYFIKKIFKPGSSEELEEVRLINTRCGSRLSL